jgi:hypothetical protein
LQGHHYFFSGSSGLSYCYYFDVLKNWVKQCYNKVMLPKMVGDEGQKAAK